MPDEEPPGEEVRIRLIQLLDNADYRITEVARRTSYPLMRSEHEAPTETSRINHLLRATDCRIHSVPLGTPEGSAGTGYIIHDPAHPSWYIKVKIEDDVAWVLSFKVSDHTQGIGP